MFNISINSIYHTLNQFSTPMITT